MDIRKLSDDYSVSPQITPADAKSIAQAGFKTVICNRPNGENPPFLHMPEIKAAVEACGLAFYDNPFDPSTFGPDKIEKQKALLSQAEKPVLAYCASGNRCSIVWAFSQAGVMDTDDIIARVEKAGYQAAHMRPALDAN